MARTTWKWLASSTGREPAGTAGHTAGSPPADLRAVQAKRERHDGWNAGFVVLTAVAELGWIALLAWTVVQLLP
jgi:hypothetical protein